MHTTFTSLLLAIAPTIIFAGPTPLDTTPLSVRQAASGSIDALFKSRGKLYCGTAADQGLLQTSQNVDIIREDYGQVTGENSMKWDALQPNPSQFSWSGADYLVNFAEENDKLIRGHTLIWHSQLPSWVSSISDPPELTSVIETHVSTVMGRYAGQKYACVSI